MSIHFNLSNIFNCIIAFFFTPTNIFTFQHFKQINHLNYQYRNNNFTFVKYHITGSQNRFSFILEAKIPNSKVTVMFLCLLLLQYISCFGVIRLNYSSSAYDASPASESSSPVSETPSVSREIKLVNTK